MRNLIIIRGLPGSGKSTFAHAITENVCEADQWFMKNGEYQFNPTELHQAHVDCRLRTEAMMASNKPIIAVANTFTREWEYAKYIEMAENYGYQVFIVVMNGPLRPNIHNVPTEVIEKMRARWED